MKQDELIYALNERIGQPELFTGRKEELDTLWKWVLEIPKRLSRSTALLSRRKKGKSAIVERLYNIVFTRNSKVIPFFFEVREGSKWIVDFSEMFYTAFISQYIGFKTRNIEFCRNTMPLAELEKAAGEYGLAVAEKDIKSFRIYLEDTNKVDLIWHQAQSAPHRIAGITDDYILQIVDEFQFLNSEIYWDKEKTRVADDLAGSYLSLAESKIAPMLVTGSWVSWLKKIIRGQLPGRFQEMELGNLTEEEGLEAVYNYSIITGVPVADDVAVYLNKLMYSDPFYISAIIRSTYKQKELTTTEGFLDVLEYELRKGSIRGTWMEYINRTFDTVNGRHAKAIVLFLSRYRDREWTRREIIEKCSLPYDDREAEAKLQMLVKGDLISEGVSSIDYGGMQDEIFYKVFRYQYEREIENFPQEKIMEDERDKQKKKIDELQSELRSLRGKERYYKEHLLEYVLIKYLKFGGFKKNNTGLKNCVYNYREGAEFSSYIEVKPVRIQLEDGREHEIDIWAKSTDDGQDIFVEAKNQEKEMIKSSVENFVRTLKDAKVLGMKGHFIFYSVNGFSDEARDILDGNGIMYADRESWPLI